MDLKEILMELGLTEGEIKIYLKLLTLGESTASNLGKEAKMERRNAYDLVDKLKKKGLISSIEKDKATYYLPLQPLKLMDLLDEKEEKLMKVRQEFTKQLPNLMEISGRKKEGVSAEVLFGKDGLKAMYLDELENGQTIYVICTTIGMTEELLKYFLPRFTKERIKRKIKMKILASESSRSMLKKYELMEVKFLPEEHISPASVTVYANKTGIALWSNEPVTVLITSKEIADNFKRYFDLMWGFAK
jgi:HTH-type transcriptional regulator, sugar sensing transcriptional regulator